MKHKQQNGFIMIFALIMVSTLTALVTYLANRTLPYLGYTKTVVEREKAKNLALGALQIAMSKLAWATQSPDDEKKTTKSLSGKPQQAKTATQLLSSIFPYLNRWQTIELTKDKDGIDGQMGFAITCEQGKLNINELYDFEKHAFISDTKTTGTQSKASSQTKKGNVSLEKQLEEFFKALGKKVGKKDLFKSLEKFLKNREYKLNDVTELLTIKGFEVFKNNIFFEPQANIQKDKIYLTDLFTIWSEKKDIEPWLFSESMGKLLNLSPSKNLSGKEREEKIKKWIKNFKETSNWQQDWNKMLEPVYGKKFDSVPSYIRSLLATRFGPRVFSVLSYGKIGEITQRFLAIVRVGDPPKEKNEPSPVKIKKLFWL